MLLGPSVDINSRLLNASFFNYLSEVDRDILNRAVQFKKLSHCNKFLSSLEQELLAIFSMFGIRQVPSPSSLLKTVPDTSKYLFLTIPMSAMCTVNAGVPVSHRPFWNSKSPVDLHTFTWA